MTPIETITSFSLADSIVAVANFGLLIAAVYSYDHWVKNRKLEIAYETIIALEEIKLSLINLRKPNLSDDEFRKASYESKSKSIKYPEILRERLSSKTNLYEKLSLLKIKCKYSFPEINPDDFDSLIKTVDDFRMIINGYDSFLNAHLKGHVEREDVHVWRDMILKIKDDDKIEKRIDDVISRIRCVLENFLEKLYK